MAHDCNTCAGTGQVTCRRCGGDGTLGEGINKETCYYCQGTGTTTCGACKGSGEIED